MLYGAIAATLLLRDSVLLMISFRTYRFIDGTVMSVNRNVVTRSNIMIKNEILNRKVLKTSDFIVAFCDFDRKKCLYILDIIIKQECQIRAFFVIKL